MKILLITPPFTQLNTPYPATAYLKPVLESAGHEVKQIDLGNKAILEIFSTAGLNKIYGELTNLNPQSEFATLNRFFALKEQYLDTIDPVIAFLQGKNDSAAHRINSGRWLPEGERQEYDEENEQGYDNARHKATLYLEEIGDIITTYCDESFGFSRYAERIALSPPRFDELKLKLDEKPSLITEIFLSILNEELELFNPDLCGFTVPFPGNLFSTLVSSKFIKNKFPKIKTLMGGGYVNTELRNLKDKRLFEYIDFVTLDDGERPLLTLCEYIEGKKEQSQLKRTYLLDSSDQLVFTDSKESKDICFRDLPSPDYTGLMNQPYLSILPVTNKMHRLWSEGKWNKMTLAHGCYWHRCAFCDTSLNYISRYEPEKAESIVNKIEKIINETGNSAFHFVDEAAPPALLKNMAIELIRRKISITWWTNIRFEKSFKPDLCRLLAKSGCIAVSGGLEVASDRLLDRIDKGVTVEQVSAVAGAFSSAGIMVHTYLMYGFPGQQEQEIIDALENVRQLFEAGLIDSAFWHQFALTAHSPVGLNPDSFGITITGPANSTFARNDLQFTGRDGYDPSIYSHGLKSALTSYMAGKEFQRPLNSWFSIKTPRTSVKKNFIRKLMQQMTNTLHINDHSLFVWTGAEISYRKGFIELHDIDGAEKIKADKIMWNFLSKLLKICNIREHKKVTALDVEAMCDESSINFDSFLSSQLFSALSAYGLLIL
jgi:Radical SAM superfamily